MKIALKITIEMSPEQVEDYCRTNGIGRDEIRQDVKDYVKYSLQDSPGFTYTGVVSVA